MEKRNPKNNIVEKKVHAKNKKDLPKNRKNSMSEKNPRVKNPQKNKVFQTKITDS